MQLFQIIIDMKLTKLQWKLNVDSPTVKHFQTQAITLGEPAPQQGAHILRLFIHGDR